MNASLSANPRAFSALLSLFATATMCSAQSLSPDTVSCTYDLADIRSVDHRPGGNQQNFTADSATPISIQCLIEGSNEPIYLPLTADTTLTKNGRKPGGDAQQINVRDNRYSQILLKFSTDPLPAKARITSARLRLTVEKVEKAGDYILRFRRLLVPWSEELSSWYQAGEKTEPWSGLQPKKDCEAEPFATLTGKDATPGAVLEVDGFAPVVQNWLETQTNYGIVADLSGPALQINFPSREKIYKLAGPANAFLALGGVRDSRIIADLNLPLIRRRVLDPADIESAELSLFTESLPKGAGTPVRIYLLPDNFNAENTDTEALGQPLFTVTPDQLAKLPIRDLIAQTMTSDVQNLRLLITLESAAAAPEQLMIYPVTHGWKNRHPSVQLQIKPHPAELLFAGSVLPRDGVFVQARDGQLYYGDQRLRLWGVCRHSTDAFNIGRLKRMGFNAIRLWGDRDFYDVESARTGKFRTFVQGDNSEFDRYDRTIAECKKQGLWIVTPGLHCYINRFASEEGSYISGGADWAEWKKASSVKPADSRFYKFFDERWRKVYFQHADNFLNHVNPYTGKRYAEEETFASFELGNEVAFLNWPLERGFDDWPSYFRDKLQQRWNTWLAEKYRSDAEVKTAWGTLGEGELLSRKTIALAPIYTQRNQYPEARGSDFLHFMVGLVDQYNAELTACCRGQAPKGIGVNVVPISFDTKYRNNLPWQYTNAKADVVSFGMYVNALSSSLTEPPGIFVVDGSSVHKKPTILYEVNQNRPNPYRSEFPLKLAVLSSWQDWDGVFWHYWDSTLQSDEEFLQAPLPYPHGNWGDGCIYHSKDPVMTSAMALGGQLFLSGLLKSAPDPTIFRIGRNAAFHYRNYAGATMRNATFSKGAHFEFDPTQEEDLKVIGENSTGRITQAILAGDEIVWDWPNGRLIVDSPEIKVYVGQTVPAYRFKDGIVLSDVKASFVCFALISQDGKPLAGADGSEKMVANAMFDARNTGFSLDLSLAKAGGGFMTVGEQVNAIRSEGRAPVVVDKVAYTLTFPSTLKGNLKQYDFALRNRGTAEIAETNVIQVADNGNRWMSRLEVTERKGEVDTTLPSNMTATGRLTSPNRIPEADVWGEVKNAWNPIRDFRWSMGYDQAHQFLRDSTLIFSKIGKQDSSTGLIVLSDAEVILNAPANVEIRFSGGKMNQISATFTQPPPYEQAVAELTGQLGKPVTARKAVQAWDDSITTWEIPQPNAMLSASLKEFQGTMGVEFTLKKN